MSDKNFDFNNTRDALGELSADLVELEASLKIKRNQLSDNKNKYFETIEQKESVIRNLTEISRNTLAKIENITDFIDEVL